MKHVKEPGDSGFGVRVARPEENWLAQRAGALPQALALDGKMIRDHTGLLTMAQHEDGVPYAVAVYDQKEGTPRCEQTAAAPLLDKMPARDGKLITGSVALPAQISPRHWGKRGDYLFQIKDNSGLLLKQAQGLDSLPNTPFLPTPNAGMEESKPGPSTPS